METLSRYLEPLTWLMWALIAIGLFDYFVTKVVPPEQMEWAMIVMWPLTGAVWFGWRGRKRQEAEAARRTGGRG